MKTIATLATYKKRYHIVWDTVQSLWHQVDELHIYDNDKALQFPPHLIQAKFKAKLHLHNAPKGDLKDLGNFYPCTIIKEPALILTCDDDILYPGNYANNMEANALNYPGIVSHHGKAIDGRINGFTTYEEMFQYQVQCTKEQTEGKAIDIPGSGVSAFILDPDSWIDFGLYIERFKLAADFYLGHFARMEQLPVKALPHKAGWIKENPHAAATPQIWNAADIVEKAIAFKKEWPCYSWEREYLYHASMRNKFLTQTQRA